MKKDKRWKSLRSHLAAYSIMAGAALAFTPDADALIVKKWDATLPPASSVSEIVIQAQQIQSQGVRHRRQKLRHPKNQNIHKMAASSKTSGSYSSSTSSTTSSYTSTTAE